MMTRLIRHADGLSLPLDAETCQQLGIDEHTPLEVTVADGKLIVAANPGAENDPAFQAALLATNERFGEALRRLAE